MSQDIYGPDLCVVDGVPYKPHPAENPRACNGCAFDGPNKRIQCQQAPCIPHVRGDGQYVHFIRADQ